MPQGMRSVNAFMRGEKQEAHLDSVTKDIINYTKSGVGTCQQGS